MRNTAGRSLALAVLAALSLEANAVAQRGGPPGPPPTPRAAAPFDITGQWVSVVSEDWRYRMTVPPKGDYGGVPLNPNGRRTADAWDPARDEAGGEQCRAFGVGGLMRLPTRVRISWVDDQTLKIESDAGTQARTIVFGPPRSQGGDWQGVSTAGWDRSAPVVGGFFPGGGARGGSLKVVTTRMKSGYLRRNGVPYSAHHRHRVLRSLRRSRRRLAAGRVDGGRRPDIPRAALLDEQPFQEANRYFRLESHTMRRTLTAAASVLAACAVLVAQAPGPVDTPAPGLDISGYWTSPLHEDSLERGRGSGAWRLRRLSD